MFKQYSKSRNFKVCMYCPDGSEFISFEKAEGEFDLAFIIGSIFKTEYENVHELQFVKDKTHKVEKWLFVKNGVTIGYIEEI